MTRTRRTSVHRPRPALWASLGLLVFAAAAAGQQKPALDVLQLGVTQVEGLVFDEPGDGTLWARGASYKARFDARGAALIPRFGASARRIQPLAFESASATQGGVPLGAASLGSVRRTGDLVQIDRGAFVEEYELSARSLEQRFVFHALPAAGELRLRLGLATELAGARHGTGLRFRSDHGHIDYGQAVAIDASGARCAMESALVEGAIELRVPAGFVAAAAFPLVVDPLITFFTVTEGDADEIEPDVSYDASTDRWCVTWSSTFGPLDSDVFARMVSGDGTPLDTVPIDITSEQWVTPAVANNNASDLFLVCAARPTTSGAREVVGRFVAAASASVGSVMPLSPPDGVDRSHPDVGGDSFTVLPSNFCVVWERPLAVGQTVVESRVVSPSGDLGLVRSLNTVTGPNVRPSISNATGKSLLDGQEGWTVVWEREHMGTTDIWGAQLFWDGSIRQSNFPVTNTFSFERRPSVSTMLDSEGFGSPRTYMVVYESVGFEGDIYATVMQDRTVLRTTHLTAFDHDPLHFDHRAPSVDSDGLRFLVAFEEREADGFPTDVIASTYYWLNDDLVACETHSVVAVTAGADGSPAVHSTASSGGAPDRFLAVWTQESAASVDVHAALWDGCSGIAPTGFCYGDGFSISCPCANDGLFGRGCANSAHADGALLRSTGDASIAEEDFVLVAEGSVPSQPGLFFQGDERVAGGVGAPFGDGLRCAGGAVRRLQLRVADGSGSAATTILFVHPLDLAPGDVKRYQWWYRDPVSSTCGAKFNLSNGLEVIWAP